MGRKRMATRLGIIIAVILVLQITLPVLAYAATYIKIVYDSTSGKIHGVIYTDKPSAVTVSTYGAGQWSAIPSPMLGERKSYTELRTQKTYYYHELDGMLEPGLSLEKIKVSESLWGYEEANLSATVTGSVYDFQNLVPALGQTDYSYIDNLDDKSYHVEISWLPVQQPGLKGYRVYRDGILVGETMNTFYEMDLPYLSKFQFGVSSISNQGVESEISLFRRFTVPGKITEVGFNGRGSGYSLQPLDSVIKFVSAQDSPSGEPDGTKYTRVGISFSTLLKTAFDGKMSMVPYSISSSELSSSDFELIDSEGTIIPASSVLAIGKNHVTLEFAQILKSGKSYTLRMSSTSSGSEIKLPEANTASGYVFLSVTDSIQSPYTYYSTDKLAIGDVEAPQKPRNLVLTPGDGRVDLTWQANTESDLQGYLVYLDGALVTPSPITQTSYALSNLINGKTYHVNVAAVDQAGNRSLQAFGFPKPVANSGGFGGFVAPPASPAPPASGTVVIKPEDLKPVGGKISVKLSADASQVQLPAAKGTAGDSPLALNGERVSLEIPAKLLDQVRQLLPAEKLTDAQISIAFEPLGKEQAESALKRTQEQLTGTVVKAAGEVFEFTLSIKSKDGETRTLSVFNTPITLRLKLLDGADPRLAGVYYIGDDGKLEFVGGKVDNGYMAADVTHFSKYAVLEYSKRFSDVPDSHWAAKAIETMAAKHVITGVTPASFAPTKQVTRAEFASMLVRQLALQAKGNSRFEDVSAGKWYERDVAAAVEAGIVRGRSAARFAPNEAVTRQEMTVMLMKAYEIGAGKPIAGEGKPSFADADQIGSWAAAYVHAANQMGFVQGKGNNRFEPLATATRAEAAQLLSKLPN